MARGRKRITVRQRHSSVCHYCEQRIHGPATWDHIVPQSLGGPNVNWNRVSACKPCNERKASQKWRDHCPRCDLAWVFFERVEVE